MMSLLREPSNSSSAEPLRSNPGGRMPTVFEEEIRSQGEHIRRRAAFGAREAAQVAESFRGVDYVLVAARGSSDNAAVFFQYFAGQELGLLVALATPSLYEGNVPIGLN